MCDHSTTCSSDEDCRLVLRNRLTRMETFEYYCKAHLVARVWDLEHDDSLDVVDATFLER
ncbi:hypothetical protein OB955_19480 [Halobacteria archaeon AArc-m2/3/4]|uniref:Uncharacterized protein n=1 Tax=Natronoglomus mannanivorans TaxID=2979990 RepID=A0AAP2Z2C1_9EURY|nr:hypothetical protein [Halobacteria archaeon AArc-xg1-1]MCU4974905.1 hypothetical protein [Halobacteria archaeon AArc-m2/3/4]